MKYLHYLPMIAAVFFLAACSDNPVDSHEEGEETFTVSLEMSTDHVETLTSLNFTVRITDHHGAATTDFEAIEVEYKLEDALDWRGIEMTPTGSQFEGAYTFMTSGSYELRVVGTAHGHDHMDVMYQAEEHLHVERAHREVGGYRIEFENFPGHVHDGQMAVVKFWVMEAPHNDGHEHNPEMITALDTEIHCEDPNGLAESHHGEEMESGLYQTEHTFQGSGEAHLALHFTRDGGPEIEADFHVPVAHAH